jgi:plasmid stability protein
VFFGEGAPEDRRRTTVAARSDLLKRTRSTDFSLDAHFRMAPATGLLLTDPGLIDPVPVDPDLADLGRELVDFDRISYGAGGGFIHRWTRVDDLALNAWADRVDFTETATGVTPYTYVELDGVWTRRLTRRVDGRMRVSAAHFRSDDDTARRLIYNATLGTNVRATRRLTLDANAGVAVIDQRTGEAADASLDQSDRSAGFIGDFNLLFTPRRDTTMTLNLSQQVSPDSLGDLRTAQVASGAVDYLINHRSSLNLFGAFTNSTEAAEGGGSRRTWTVSPSYRHALSRTWDLELSYRWIKSDDAQSNSALLTLSHRGTLLP